MEIWKVYKENRNFIYEVSTLGNIMRNGKIQKCPANGNGYKKFSGKSVHRIVIETFIGKHEYKNCVNHIDGNKLNNSLDNLEWVTHSENTKHAITTGLIDLNYLVTRAKIIGFKKGQKLSDKHRQNIGNSVSGFRNPNSKINPELALEINNMKKEGFSYSDIARKLNLSVSAIWKFLNNKTQHTI